MADPTRPNAVPPPLVFFCRFCGKRLSVAASMAGVGGPCPACAAWITAPTPADRIPVGTQVGDSAAPGRVTQRPARMLADLAVDSGHQERRETGKLLVILAAAVVVASLCALVFYFLKDWGSR